MRSRGLDVLVLISAFAVYLVAAIPAVGGAQGPGGSARTVWDGAYSDAQADRGRTQYAGHCAECHGGELQGREASALAGDKFWMDWGEQGVDDLLAYVSKNMPFSEDGSLAGTLPASAYADIVAHILRANGFPAGMQELSAASAAGMQIVKKDGPGELPASTLAQVVGCLAPRDADGSWRVVRATAPVRATAASRPDPKTPSGDREYALKFVLTPLTRFVGHQVAVTGLLIGPGGVDGLNVSTVESIASSCS